MCFTITSNSPRRKTAQTDITCFKAVERVNSKKHYISLFQGFKYCLGKTYRSKLLREGYCVNIGIHSYMHVSRANTSASLGVDRVIQCIIPRGSKYYLNDDRGEFVSDKIKLVKVIKRNNLSQ